MNIQNVRQLIFNKATAIFIFIIIYSWTNIFHFDTNMDYKQIFTLFQTMGLKILNNVN